MPAVVLPHPEEALVAARRVWGGLSAGGTLPKLGRLILPGFVVDPAHR